jgi:hypothetical protein
MNRNSSAATGGMPRPCGPHQERAFNAKVDGIMRIAGFIRGEDGHWYKPESRHGEPTASRDAVKGL